MRVRCFNSYQLLWFAVQTSAGKLHKLAVGVHVIMMDHLLAKFSAVGVVRKNGMAVKIFLYALKIAWPIRSSFLS